MSVNNSGAYVAQFVPIFRSKIIHGTQEWRSFLTRPKTATDDREIIGKSNMSLTILHARFQ